MEAKARRQTHGRLLQFTAPVATVAMAVAAEAVPAVQPEEPPAAGRITQGVVAPAAPEETARPVVLSFTIEEGNQ